MALIVLPWFPKACAPNHRSRSHWPRTNAMKLAKGWAYVATRETGARMPGEGPLTVKTVFHPPTAHARDEDNLTASCKGYFDGIAQALGVDDSRFRHEPIEIAEPVKGGKILVSVVE